MPYRIKELVINQQIQTKPEEHFYAKINERFGVGWFDFTDSVYVNLRTHMTAKCLRHDHTFKTTPANFIACHINPCKFCVVSNRRLLSKKGQGEVLPDPLEAVANLAFKPKKKRVYRSEL